MCYHAPGLRETPGGEPDTGGRTWNPMSVSRTPLWQFMLPGFIIAGVYLAVTVMMPQAPRGRILYDGTVPLPPYRWVHAPAGSNP